MFKTVAILIILALGLTLHAQEQLELGQSHKLPNLSYSISYPATWSANVSSAGGQEYARLVLAETQKDALDEAFIYFDPFPLNPLEGVRISFSTEPLSLL